MRADSIAWIETKTRLALMVCSAPAGSDLNATPSTWPLECRMRVTQCPVLSVHKPVCSACASTVLVLLARSFTAQPKPWQ
jgi:hypothetical protein